MSMHRIRKSFVLAVAIVAVALGSAATIGAQAKVDLTGKWIFDVKTDAGTGTPTVTFKQDGEKLTGHYSSQTLGEADLTGTVKGADIAFSFSGDVQGQSITSNYKGTIESNTSMKGTLEIVGLGAGTFTAKKK